MNESTDPQASDPGVSAGAASSTQLDLLDRAIQRLEEAERTAPRRTSEWLLAEVLGCDRGQLYAHPDRPVPPDSVRRFEAMVERRVQGEPLQHILGYASFYGLQIRVSPEVMVPRPETEEVVEQALACIEEIDAPRVLDVGTGSGCIALALKHERPDALVHACDVSSEALAVAEANARRLQVDVHLFEADLTSEGGFDRLPGDLDLLVSNPPYIPDEEADTLPAVVRDYDPSVALFAGDDPLFFYRALADWVWTLCKGGAAVVFETHAEYAEEVVALLRTEGLVDIRVDEDLSGRPRIVWGRRPRQ